MINRINKILRELILLAIIWVLVIVFGLLVFYLGG